MFKELKEINSRPAPFECYTADDLWTDPHTSKRMLEYHLNESVDMSSRNKNFIDSSARWMASRFQLSEGAEIADFGCGPGLYAERLAERGAKVTGIDFSENSIRYAKQTADRKNLEIRYARMNYLDFDTTDRFDLIIMIMCDFCALSPGQRKTMLSKFRSLLKPEGALLLDVYSLNSFNRREESATYEFNQLNGFWSPDDYYGFVNTFKYENEKVALDKYTLIEANRKRVVYNWLQYFSEDSLKKEFEENGFRVDALYSDVAGKPLTPDSDEIAIVAVT
ncbi:Class I SAM-dependent methyltransferase [Candidatus Desulfarcum epimagneticum]|uniref:Class I SAM-dependent methyltransferase n=1 Tax=uncultured Desulfobacteraceae bacterium TaxID=218296 RepID=A0A484HB86_9BACT|nr:Class I SAM-dependent methyltransferase [uncultured Desulfobacteraceae bacterium]